MQRYLLIYSQRCTLKQIVLVFSTGSANLLYLLLLCLLQRWGAHVSTGPFGGNGWHEAHSDKSNPELHRREVQSACKGSQRTSHVWSLKKSVIKCLSYIIAVFK